MRYKNLLGGYLLVQTLLVVVPLAGLNVSLADIFVLKLRLDCLLHMIAFLPLVALLHLGFPQYSVRVVFGTGLTLAVMLEGVHFFLPYRSFDINDAAWNMIGVSVGYVGYWLKFRFF